MAINRKEQKRDWICEKCRHRETKEGDDPVLNFSCKYNYEDYPFVVACSFFEPLKNVVLRVRGLALTASELREYFDPCIGFIHVEAYDEGDECVLVFPKDEWDGTRNGTGVPDSVSNRNLIQNEFEGYGFEGFTFTIEEVDA